MKTTRFRDKRDHRCFCVVLECRNRMDTPGKFQSREVTFGAELSRKPTELLWEPQGPCFQDCRRLCAMGPILSLTVIFEFGPADCATHVTLLEVVFISLLKLSHFQGREKQFQVVITMSTKTTRYLLNGHGHRRDGEMPFLSITFAFRNLLQKLLIKVTFVSLLSILFL